MSNHAPTVAPVSLDELLSPYICSLIYGGPGVGKTVVACGSQYMRTFLFDVDHGSMSLASTKTSELLVSKGFPPIQKHLIKVWPVHSYKDIETGLDYFYRYQNSFDLAVVDTATELQRIVMTEQKAKSKHIVADQRDWGIALDVMEFLGRSFREMKKHSIFLAHELESYDQNTSSNRFRASFKGAFAQDYRKHFSLIMRYLMVDQQQVNANQQLVTETIRCLDCNRDPYNDAKDRSSALNKYEVPIIDNIFYKVLSAIHGGTPQT